MVDWSGEEANCARSCVRIRTRMVGEAEGDDICEGPQQSQSPDKNNCNRAVKQVADKKCLQRCSEEDDVRSPRRMNRAIIVSEGSAISICATVDDYRLMSTLIGEQAHMLASSYPISRRSPTLGLGILFPNWEVCQKVATIRGANSPILTVQSHPFPTGARRSWAGTCLTGKSMGGLQLQEGSVPLTWSFSSYDCCIQLQARKEAWIGCNPWL